MLDLSTLALAQVRYGSNAGSIARDRIVEVTFSPIVSSYENGAYLDTNGAHLSLDDVIESVIRDAGVLHLPGGMSFGITDGRVTRFSLYGQFLEHFSDIKTYDQFERSFGKADTTKREELEGELVEIAHYYKASSKCVWWDLVGQVRTITLGSLPL